MTKTTNRPRIDHTGDHFGRCELHAIPCCAICCKHENECEYGACSLPAVVTLDCFAHGNLIERRDACHKHASYGPLGVGYRCAGHHGKGSNR